MSTENLISLYENSSDLYTFVQQMDRLGQRGNPNAYAMAGLAIRSCMMMNSPGYENYLYSYSVERKVHDISQYHAAIARLKNRCTRLISTGEVSNALIQSYLKKSAVLGSPIGAAKLAQADPAMAVSKLRSTVDSVMASANPIAIRALSESVGPNSPLKGDDVGKASDSYGLQIFSCHLANDCGSGSVLMMQLCINTKFCKPTSYVSFLKNSLPPDTYRRAVALSSRLMHQLNSGERPKLRLTGN